MTRILSYNIQTGGTHRTDKLATFIAAIGPDVVGLTEATDAHVAQELAERLGMQVILSGEGKHKKDWQVGILSRLSIRGFQRHLRPEIFTKQNLLEVCIEEADGNILTVFVAHLTAAFHKRSESDRIRRNEVQEILRVMATKQGTSHLLMGDFNAISPGEGLKASALLSYVMNPEQDYLKKYKEFIERVVGAGLAPARLLSGRPQGSPLPFITRSYSQILEAIPRNKLLTSVADTNSPLFLSIFAPRAGIEQLNQSGYVDCYRRMNQQKPGFTYPALAPAGRIDFIFASPEMAQRLEASYVVVKAAGIRGSEASDHLPVFAE